MPAPAPIRQRNSARHAAAVARRRQVAAARLAGVSDQTSIARQLGVNKSIICRDFAWLDEQYRVAAAADIAVEKGRDIERIEAAISFIWSDVRGPASGATRAEVDMRLRAVDRLVVLLDRKARLLGLDAPKVVRIDLEARIRAMAEAEGWDPDEAVREAQRLALGPGRS